tara:strand:+ start:912 stop:1364 length:453 start_codon:yes stop_codon:yes gene_type:complete
METLFVLSKKFGNRRIVRNIYQFATEERKYWLKKYRHAIHHGYTFVAGNQWSWDHDKGIKTAYLKWTPDGRESDEWWIRHRPAVRRFISGDRNVSGLEESSRYVTPLSMNTRVGFLYKFTTQMLIDNCIENNIDVTVYSRENCIQKLMKI